jgi:serine/threonine-protein kinase
MSDEPTVPFALGSTDPTLKDKVRDTDKDRVRDTVGDSEATLGSQSQGAAGATGAAQAQWGSFVLMARVGSGGFGEVYRAWDPHLQRVVALKLMLPGSVSGEQEYEAMLREARALASVRHANIVPVHGIDRHEGRVGFWTDFVHGKTLTTLVAEQGVLGAREAALIGLDVARALSAVHRAGFLHRDIKAENVMREDGGRILLMDFGLSSLQQRVTGVAGTPNYMAPELFEGGKATVATDIYALGVLLYFLVTGTYPAQLTGVSAADSLARLAHRKPLMDVRPDVPEPLLRAVTRALEIDPAKRYLSAGQLAEALGESLEVAMPASAAATATATAPAKTEAKRGWVWGALALVVVVALGLGWWQLEERNKPPATPAVPEHATGTAYDEYQKAQELLTRSYKNANVAAAIEGFQRVLRADPKFALADAGLGAAYFIQYGDRHDPKLLDRAQEASNAAIALDANSAPAYVTLARIAATRGDNALAMEQVQKALSMDGRSAEAQGALGEVYEAESKAEEAEATYRKAIDLAPDDWRWPVRLGVELFGAGKVKEAIEQLKRGADLAPDNAVAYYDLGMAYRQLDDIDAARKNFEASLKIESDANTYDALGSVFLLEGRYDDAVAMEQESIQLNPNNYVAWGDLGVAYLWSGNRHDEAVKALSKANELAEAEKGKNRQDPLLLVTLANNYASLGDAAKSEVLVRQALALAGQNPEIEYRAGEAYESLGRRSEAIGLIASALGQGYDEYELQHNPELKALRTDPAFERALREAKRKKK